MPLFQKPFGGDFPLTNFFDHNLPFEFEDTNGFLLTWWGERTGGVDGHSGYDWTMPEGTSLLAAADGEVIFAGTRQPFFCPPLGQTVNNQQNVMIRHVAPNGEWFISDYAHLSRIEVQQGQQVAAGQQIGLSGNTGCSGGPHIHFGVLRQTNTTSGQSTLVDPYGWEGTTPDPWAQHPQGAQSFWLWKEGQAPAIFREFHLAPNPTGSTAPVTITAVRWMGWKDEQNPNNEFVELTLDLRFVPSGTFDLTGFLLRNNEGESFSFPSGFQIHQDLPVRIFTGSGTNTAIELYWGLSQGVWDNFFGDCAQLLYPGGGRYGMGFSSSCVKPGAAYFSFESPENGPVSGIAVIRGWAFATQAGVSITKVELFIDGVSAGDIPCCPDRADVQAAYPQFPASNTLNSGWGTTFNWGVLSAGTHKMRIEIRSLAADLVGVATRTVAIVKAGNFEFLDQFSLSGATARIEGDQLVVEGVVVRDKASQQKKLVNARYRWFTSSQSLQTVEAVTTATISSLRSFFTEMFTSLSARVLRLSGATTAQAAPGIGQSFESPEVNQVVAGIGVIRGWAFTDTPGTSLNEVRLVIDGMPSSFIPCCSARGDVAAAFPANPNALNSGWGFTINYGNLPTGFHTIGIRFGDSTGASLTDDHGVTVVKIGGFEFLDQFNLAGATVQIQGEEMVLSGVQVRDKASQQTRVVTVRLRWLQSAQALGIVAAAG